MEVSLLLSLLSITCLISWIEGSLQQPEINGASTALMYLSRFGYIDPSVTNPENGALMSGEAVTSAIKDFQAFAGLNQTGTLDSLTVEMMNTPRCGVVDKVGYGSNARKKRYALQGSRWKVNDLTYKITKYPKLLTKAEVDRDIDRAFQVWADVTQLTFQAASSGKVQIEIRFERAEHGDGDAFDGPGGTLAHAYFPIYGGDAHFDDSEVWTVNSYRGTNLFQVAAHEFGHSLGLSHSDVQSALMAPFYRGYQSQFALDEDDISAIQSLYGEKTTKDKKPQAPKPTYPSKPSDSDSPLCADSSIDAIFTMEDKSSYAFKGEKCWKLNDDGISPGYPKAISSEFEGLPSNIDTAFTWNNGKTYFFKGSKYWRFTGLIMDEDYPKSITKGFMGIPSDIDAAFVWSGNGKIYFFKGSSYYKFDPTKRPPVSEKYPKDISIWEGIPNNIDDALHYSNGFTYFFKNGKYWRFNDRSFKVDTADPPFPRHVGIWWFGCADKGNQETPDYSVPKKTPSGDVYEDDSINAAGSNEHSGSLHPRIGFSRSHGYTTAGGGSASIKANHLSWLIIPFLLRIICF